MCLHGHISWNLIQCDPYCSFNIVCIISLGPAARLPQGEVLVFRITTTGRYSREVFVSKQAKLILFVPGFYHEPEHNGRCFPLLAGRIRGLNEKELNKTRRTLLHHHQSATLEEDEYYSLLMEDASSSVPLIYGHGLRYFIMGHLQFPAGWNHYCRPVSLRVDHEL